MSDSNALVNRVYDIKIQGYDGALKNLNSLTVAFNKLDETKRKTDEQLKKAIEAGNLKTIQDLSAKLKELETQIKNLDATREKSAKEVKALAEAEKLAAETTLLKTKNTAAEIAIEEKKQTATRKTSSDLKSYAGNYYELLALQKQYIEAYRLTDPSSKFFETARQNAIQATNAVQAFNRSLSPDGTLVGEYKSGILNAFKDLGLNDVIRKQKDDISTQLNAIKQQNKDLAGQYRATAEAGGEAFRKVEKDLQDNINLQEKLNNSLHNINATLDNTGGIGRQVTTSIREGFKGLITQATQFYAGYLSFQAVIGATQKTFSETVQLDSLNTALKNVSGTEAEFAVNQQYLLDTTDKLGLVVLDTTKAYKNFYAASTQAGISADETRRIFFAATSSSAALKLSQEDTNGVLLAFGQIASKGKVQAEELRGQIGERIPGAFSIAARAIGVTQQELNKMLQNGQVISSEFLPKFAAELQKTFAGDTTKNIEGLQASINRLKNEFTAIVESNREGLTKFITGLISVGGGVLSFIAMIASLPFPLIVVGLTAVTASVVLYKTEQIRAYVATQLASQQGIIYNAALLIQAAYTRSVALVTRLATAEVVLFNGAIRISPLGIFLTALGIIIPAVALFAKNAKQAKIEIDALNDVNKQAGISIRSQIAPIENWIAVIKSAATSADTKKRAVEELIKIDQAFGNVMRGNVIDLNELDKAYRKVTDAIGTKARAEASAKLTAEKEEKIKEISLLRQRLETSLATGQKSLNSKDFTDTERGVFMNIPNLNNLPTLSGDIEIGGVRYQSSQLLKVLNKQEADAREVFIKYLEISDISQSELDKLKNKDNPTKGPAGRTIDAIQQDLKTANADFEKSVIGSKEYNDLKQKIVNLNEELKLADAKPDKVKKEKEYKGSRLSGETKDQFKDIDAGRNELIAQAEQFYAEGKLNEQDYLNDILQINQNAIDAKLNKLIKPANAAERIEVANLHKERIDKETETNKKLFELYSKDAEVQLRTQQRAAQRTLDTVINDPNSSFTQKVNARQEFNFKDLAAQQNYNSQMNSLELKYNQKSNENELSRADALKKILTDIRLQRLAELDAEIQDIQKKGDATVAKTKQVLNEQKLAILNSSKSKSEKATSVGALNDVSEIAALTNEITTMELLLPKLKAQIGLKEGAEAEYLAFYNNYVGEIEKLNKLLGNSFDTTTTKGKISSRLSGALGYDIKKDDDDKTIAKKKAQQQNLGQTISDTYAFAQNAMNSYFDAEARRIEQSKQATYDQIDAQKQVLLSHAQSQVEKDRIEADAAAKKKVADKKAFEENKKMQIAQAEINLATQLSNLAVIAFAPGPANFLTIGAAGAIMYAIQAGLAFANFGLNVSRINSAQAFATGGRVLPNGKITASQNIPTQPNGDSVIATVRPGEVILNEKQQAMLGGPSTFAMMGVPGFAGGGYAGYGGNIYPGDNLLPPINPQSFINGRSDINAAVSADVLELKKMVAIVSDNVNNVTEHVRTLKVQVVAGEVDETNKKLKKANAIGVL